MTDVGVALLAHRPRCGVHVVPAVGEPDRVVHQFVVAVADHPDRVALFQGDVRAVHRVQARPAGADRPVPPQPALVEDVRVVRPGVDHGDQRVTDHERLGQVGGEEHARGGLHAVQVPVEGDRGVRRPVVHRAEVQGLVAVPVPGAGDRLGAGDLQGPLHRGLIGHGGAEGQPDRDAHAVALLVALEDHRRVGGRRGQRAEAAGGGDRVARRVHRGGVHGVTGGRLQRPGTLPGRAGAVQRAAHAGMPGGDRDALDLPPGRGDPDAVARVGVLRAVSGADRELHARRGGRGLAGGGVRVPGRPGLRRAGRRPARAGAEDQARRGADGSEPGHPGGAGAPPGARGRAPVPGRGVQPGFRSIALSHRRSSCCRSSAAAAGLPRSHHATCAALSRRRPAPPRRGPARRRPAPPVAAPPVADPRRPSPAPGGPKPGPCGSAAGSHPSTSGGPASSVGWGSGGDLPPAGRDFHY